MFGKSLAEEGEDLLKGKNRLKKLLNNNLS